MKFPKDLELKEQCRELKVQKNLGGVTICLDSNGCEEGYSDMELTDVEVIKLRDWLTQWIDAHAEHYYADFETRSRLEE